MTGLFWLDWAILAVSIFNALLLLWLGVTVLLNAERRTWGIWLAGGGLLAGAAFFVSHSAILGHGPLATTTGMEFWWRVGWAPLVAAPFAWYTLMLWYTGGWEHGLLPAGQHRTPFVLTTTLTVVLIGLFLFANPFPTYYLVTRLQLAPAPTVAGIPILVLVYVVYIVLCISMSLHVLRHPGPPGRIMGDQARRRARPWLVAASTTLLLVSLLMTWTILWVITNSRQGTPTALRPDMVTTLGWVDLAASMLLAFGVVLLGQAIVAYELFTGKSLPRRGFRRYWRSAVILAAGYAALVSWSLTIQLRPVYGLLLTAVLMIAFYALLVWRSFGEREQTMNHLRPFVSSQQMYDQLLTGSAHPPVDQDPAAPLRALCEEVLGTRLAYLAAVGPLTPLVAPLWAYPPAAPGGFRWLSDVTARLRSTEVMTSPLDPLACSGFNWAVPLWGTRGLIGVLLLGNKRDGGLYTQEEIEVARAAGERIIDMQASAELARRLMTLQRQRLAESQLLDQRARRALHDDILPRLHAAMLTLSSAPPDRHPQQYADTTAALADIHQRLSDLLRSLPAPGAPQRGRLGLVGALRRTVEDELPDAFSAVTWQVEPLAEEMARRLPAMTTEIVFYAAREAMRNAARHARAGVPGQPLHLSVTAAWRTGLEVHVQDDGIGIANAVSAGENSGQGLALHSAMMAVIGGSLSVETVAGAGTRVVLALPQEAIGMSPQQNEVPSDSGPPAAH